MKTWRSYAVTIGLLLATVLLTSVAGTVNTTSEPGIIMSLPQRVGAWEGHRAEVTDRELRSLPADTEFERKLYRDAAGHEIFCSIVLAGKDSRSIHRPETCLPAQGWVILDGHYETIPMNTNSIAPLTVRALKIRFQTPDATPATSGTRLNYYWFMGKDRLTASHLQRIVWNSYDRIIHNVNHRWAYITVTAPVPPAVKPGESPGAEQEVREQLNGFVRRLVPQLKRPGQS